MRADNHIFSFTIVFRLNLFAFIQSETFAKCSFKVLAIDSTLLLDASICVSSANILHFVYFKQLGRSLTYIRNNSGPSIDPWGIPHIISNAAYGECYNINWSIVKRVKPYQAGATSCSLCIQEKLCIMNADKETLLNKRSELISKCRHENKFYACKCKP